MSGSGTGNEALHFQLWRSFGGGELPRKPGLDRSQTGAPMPSSGRVWSRLSNITLTNVRGRPFPCQLLSSEFIKMHPHEASLSPSNSLQLNKTARGALNDVNHTNYNKSKQSPQKN